MDTDSFHHAYPQPLTPISAGKLFPIQAACEARAFRLLSGIRNESSAAQSPPGEIHQVEDLRHLLQNHQDVALAQVYDFEGEPGQIPHGLLSVRSFGLAIIDACPTLPRVEIGARNFHGRVEYDDGKKQEWACSLRRTTEGNQFRVFSIGRIDLAMRSSLPWKASRNGARWRLDECENARAHLKRKRKLDKWENAS
ncbi:hypothetical protein C8R47DRAFT_1068169 [Mycena vitilis]|nr:hypothetical protein C8R47DRAFT_1068169 [Mycena vitilis]